MTQKDIQMPSDPRVVPGWLMKLVGTYIGVITLAAIPWAWNLSKSMEIIGVRIEEVPAIAGKLEIVTDRSIENKFKILANETLLKELKKTGEE